MRNYLFLFSLSYFLVSCLQRDTVENSHINLIEKIAIDSTDIDIDTVVSNNEVIKISKLPFYANYQENEMDILIRKSPKAYNLPKIKNFKYISTGYERDSICVDTRGKKTKYILNSILKFSEFRYKLPSFALYDIYLVCDDKMDSVYKMNKVQRSDCPDFIHPLYGYMILYNVKNSNAIVFGVYFEGLNSGNSIRRTFYVDNIDKNYVITVWDHVDNYYEDDGNGYMEHIKREFTITIQETGEIVVENHEAMDYIEDGKKVIVRKPEKNRILLNLMEK